MCPTRKRGQREHLIPGNLSSALRFRKVGTSDSRIVVSKSMVPAGTPEAGGTGFGQPESITVAFPGGPLMTGLLWGTGSSAQPGEVETDRRSGRDRHLSFSQPCSGTYVGSVAAYGVQAQHASGDHGSLAMEEGTWGCTHMPVCCPSQGTCRKKAQRSRSAGNGGHSGGGPSHITGV